MNYCTGLSCIKCGARYPIEPQFQGCSRCATDKFRSNLTPAYDYDKIGGKLSPDELKARRADMWRFREFLPLAEETAVSIGEGMTPLVRCRKLGDLYGVKAFYIKDESRNPTWSFKDRLCSVAVSKAKEFGAKTIVASSTGNHGASAAAYAARAGLRCVIFTHAGSSLSWRSQMQMCGAMLLATETMAERWTIMAECVEHLGWYPVSSFSEPIIGADPFGIDGYKTIGHEICQQLNWSGPDVVIMPVGYGDGLFGAWKGFCEFFDLGLVRSKPRMVAAEVFGPISHAIARGLDFVGKVPGGTTVAISSGVTSSAYHGLKAVKESAGTALAATEEEILAAQKELATAEGIYSEASSATTIAAFEKLRSSNWIRPDDVVICILTSTGLKNSEVNLDRLPRAPRIKPTIEALERALRQTYGFDLKG